MNRQTVIIVALFIIGLLAGWFAYQDTQPPIPQAEKTENYETKDNRIQNESKVTLKKEPSLPPSALREVSYETNAPSIIEYIQQRSLDKTYGGMGDRELRNLIHRTPGLAYEVLEQLILLEDGASKENLTQLLLGLQLVKQANLDKWIVEKIRREQRPSEWLQMLGKLGVQSVDSVLFVNELFSNLTEPGDIKAAISAVSNTGLVTINIPPTERSRLTSNIKPHLDSSYESIRAAAVASLQNYPSEDLEIQVLKALDDQSHAVRSKAMMVFANRASHSKALKTQAITNLQNSSLHPAERQSIAFVLGSLQLDANERALLEQANSDIKLALSKLSQDELFKYSRKARADR